MSLAVRTATGGTASLQTTTNPDGTLVTVHSGQTAIPTKAFSVATVTPVATPTDFAVITGPTDVTKRARIRRIIVGGLAGTAGSLLCQLYRRSVVDSGGTAALTAVTGTKLDTTDANFTSTVKYVQTGNYGSLGTGTVIATRRLWLDQVALPTNAAVFEFGNDSQPLYVENTDSTDLIYVNFAGAALPSGTKIDLSVVLEEVDA